MLVRISRTDWRFVVSCVSIWREISTLVSRFYNPLTPRSDSHGTSSFKYPYVINRKGNRNTQTYQVEVVSLDLTPNSCNLFT